MAVAWTTPRTWTDGLPMRPDYFNTDVRDNQRYLYRIQKVQQADQTVTANTASTDLLAGETFVNGDTWIFKFALLYTTVVGSNGIVFQVSGGPANGAGVIGSVCGNRTTPANVEMRVSDTITTADFAAPLAAAGGKMEIRGVYVVIITTATLGLNFRPFTAGNNVTLKAGSSLIAERVVTA